MVTAGWLSFPCPYLCDTCLIELLRPTANTSLLRQAATGYGVDQAGNHYGDQQLTLEDAMDIAVSDIEGMVSLVNVLYTDQVSTFSCSSRKRFLVVHAYQPLLERREVPQPLQCWLRIRLWCRGRLNAHDCESRRFSYQTRKRFFRRRIGRVLLGYKSFFCTSFTRSAPATLPPPTLLNAFTGTPLCRHQARRDSHRDFVSRKWTQRVSGGSLEPRAPRSHSLSRDREAGVRVSELARERRIEQRVF